MDIPPNATTAQLRDLFDANQSDDHSVHSDGSDHSVHSQHSEWCTVNGVPNGQGDEANRAAGLVATEEAIDAEIRILNKKKQLLELRRELALLEGPIVPARPAQPRFKDIKHTVPFFSGDEVYDAEKWIKSFERACDSVHGDGAFRLQSIKRMMVSGSTAETFLVVDESKTYEEFRRNFLGNFGHTYSVSDIIDKMRRTPFSAAKTSVNGYILKMQELASRTNLDETQTIQFAIEGFRDRSANIAVLYSARTIDELKQLAHRYAQLRELSSAHSVPSTSGSTSASAQSRPNPKGEATSDPSAVRCFNCSGTGHYSSSCPEPKRDKGSCFRCGSHSHVLKDCPKPPPANPKQVALIDSFRSGTDARSEEETSGSASNSVGETNEVSVAFQLGGKFTHSNTILSLFDTGSPISLIKRSEIPIEIPSGPMKESGFKGVGNHNICTYGRIFAEITFRNIKKIIEIYVILDKLMHFPLLLGRDFSKSFQINLSFSNRIFKPKIELDAKKNKLKIAN